MPKKKNPLFGGGEPSAQELQLYAAQDMMPQLFKKYPQWALENGYTTIAAPKKKRGFFSRLFESDDLSESQKREAEMMAATILAAESPSSEEPYINLDEEAEKARDSGSPKSTEVTPDAALGVGVESILPDNQKTTHATTQASNTSKIMSDNPDAAEEVLESAGDGEIKERDDAITGPSNVVDFPTKGASDTGKRKEAGDKESVNTPAGAVVYFSSYMARLFDDQQSFYTLIAVERIKFNEDGEPSSMFNIAGIIHKEGDQKGGTLNPHELPALLLGNKKDVAPSQKTLGRILRMAGVNGKYQKNTMQQATTRDAFLNSGSQRSPWVMGTVSPITKALVSMTAYAVLRKNTPLYVPPDEGRSARNRSFGLDGPPSYKEFSDNGGTRPSAIWPRTRILLEKKNGATLWEKGLMSEFTTKASEKTELTERPVAYVTNSNKFSGLSLQEYFSKKGPMMGTSNAVPFIKTQEMTPEQLADMAQDPNFSAFYNRTMLDTNRGTGTFFRGKTGLSGGYAMRYVGGPEGADPGLEQKWDSPVLYSLNSGFINMILLADKVGTYKVSSFVSAKVKSCYSVAEAMIGYSVGRERTADAVGKGWWIPDSDAAKMMIETGTDLTNFVLPSTGAERVLGSQVYKIVEKPKRLPFINPMLLDLHAAFSRVSPAQKLDLYSGKQKIKDVYGVAGNWRMMKQGHLNGMSQFVDEAAQYYQRASTPGQIAVMQAEKNQISNTIVDQFVRPGAQTSAMMKLLGTAFFGGAQCDDAKGKCKFILVPYFENGKAVDYFLALFISKDNPKSSSSLSSKPHLELLPSEKLLPRVAGTGKQKIHFARKMVGEEDYPLFFSDLFTLVAEARSGGGQFQPAAVGNWSDGDSPMGKLAELIEDEASLKARRERVASYNRMLGMSEYDAERISGKARQATQDAEERSSTGEKARQATQDAEKRSSSGDGAFDAADFNVNDANPRPRRRRIRKIRRR